MSVSRVCSGHLSSRERRTDYPGIELVAFESRLRQPSR